MYITSRLKIAIQKQKKQGGTPAMKKRILAPALALCLIIALSAPAASSPAANPIDIASPWAREGIAQAIRSGFVPAEIQGDYMSVITRREFCRMAVKWVEYALMKDIDTILAEKGLSRNPNPFTDTTDPDILAAYALGITAGTSAAAFSPNGQFTREQAATMIRNTCRAIGVNVENPPISDFTDLHTASAWARDGINFVRANGVMQGTSTAEAVFSPSLTYTREQSIVTLNNIKLSSLPGFTGTDPAGIIELSVLNYFSMANPGARAEHEAIWLEFEKDHPHIKIIREDLYEEPFHDKTAAHVAAGTLPDVISVWPSGRSSVLHENRLLLDLAPLVERDGLAANFTAFALDPTAQAGGYLGMLPRGTTSSHVMYVNLEVLESAGLQPAKTYSELAAQVPILRAAGYDTILMANEAPWVMQSCLFSMVAGRFMGEGWHEKIIAGEAKFTDPDFVAALDFVKKMYDDGVLSCDTLFIDYGPAPGFFANNAAAYYIDGDWRIGDFINNWWDGDALIPLERQKNFRVTVFPEIDLPGVKFNRSSTAVLSNGWGLNANLEGEKLEAAWTLLKWLTGKEAITHLLKSGTIIAPARTDINYDALDMGPLQIAMAKFGSEYEKSTVIIDGVFAWSVFEPINSGLWRIGAGTQSPAEVAWLAHEAFEFWRDNPPAW
jgi:raffinose/stachyose/melibiose transport system substrate-binding protein